MERYNNSRNYPLRDPLYDLKRDPEEINNPAGDTSCRETQSAPEAVPGECFR